MSKYSFLENVIPFHPKWWEEGLVSPAQEPHPYICLSYSLTLTHSLSLSFAVRHIVLDPPLRKKYDCWKNYFTCWLLLSASYITE